MMRGPCADRPLIESNAFRTLRRASNPATPRACSSPICRSRPPRSADAQLSLWRPVRSVIPSRPTCFAPGALASKTRRDPTQRHSVRCENLSGRSPHATFASAPPHDPRADPATSRADPVRRPRGNPFGPLPPPVPSHPGGWHDRGNYCLGETFCCCGCKEVSACNLFSRSCCHGRCPGDG